MSLTYDEKQELLSKLSDQDIKDEMESRDLVPDDLYYCDCEQDKGLILDPLQKDAMYAGIKALRDINDLAGASRLEEILEELR